MYHCRLRRSCDRRAPSVRRGHGHAKCVTDVSRRECVPGGGRAGDPAAGCSGGVTAKPSIRELQLPSLPGSGARREGVRHARCTANRWRRDVSRDLLSVGARGTCGSEDDDYYCGCRSGGDAAADHFPFGPGDVITSLGRMSLLCNPRTRETHQSFDTVLPVIQRFLLKAIDNATTDANSGAIGTLF